eukprot:scaffold4308_cov152-Skeletonema_menzelii.AAC.4
MNNINGHGGGRRSAMASMDFYRRVPKDLTERRPSEENGEQPFYVVKNDRVREGVGNETRMIFGIALSLI